MAGEDTHEHHADPRLRPRVYDAPYDDVVRLAATAARELSHVVFAEADPRRGVVSAWVRLLPVVGLPGRKPREAEGAPGYGWSLRFDPALAHGWLQVRITPLDEKGGPRTRVEASVRLHMPRALARPIARKALRDYLHWMDLRRGEPRTG